MGSIFAEKALYGSVAGITNPSKSGRALGSAFRGMRTAFCDFIFGTVRSSAVQDRSRNKRPPQSPSSSLERESGLEAPFPPQAIPSHCMNSSAAYECAGPSVSPQCPFMARDVGLWLDPNGRCPPTVAGAACPREVRCLKPTRVGRTAGMGAKQTTLHLLFNFPFLKNQLFKKTRPKRNPTTHVSLRKIPVSDRTASCGDTFAQSVNRTKMFHVKHFGKVGPENLTKLIAHASLTARAWPAPRNGPLPRRRGTELAPYSHIPAVRRRDSNHRRSRRPPAHASWRP